ncbi:MAG TPA: MraY family glycosyltransferase [Methylomirabilota bacterium]|nr:MraY family glycosyltransferase [Methylomirabilota bacterium]
MSVAAGQQVAPQPLGVGELVRGAGRLTLVGVLCLPWVRGWFAAASLDWAYLAALAWALAFFGVPVVRRAALALGVLDAPSARKVHRTPTPLLGGAAVYAAFAVTILFNFSFSRDLKGVAVGASIVVALGLLDDVWDLPAPVKLAGQMAGVGAAMAYGIMLSVVPYWWPGAGWLNLALTLVWFLTVTNAVQFLDGMDGLAAGLGVVAGLFFSVTAWQTGQPYLFILAAPLVGACLGFLPYNFRPGGARIFLGDSGASFIGFTLAGLAVMGEWAHDDPLVALLTPILILAVPLFDIAFVGVVRVVTGKVHSLREWLAYTGKDHIHHRFEAVGLSRAQSVLLILFIACTLGLSAILLKFATPREAALLLIQAGCVLAIIAILEGVGRGRPDRS